MKKTKAGKKTIIVIGTMIASMGLLGVGYGTWTDVLTLESGLSAGNIEIMPDVINSEIGKIRTTKIAYHKYRIDVEFYLKNTGTLPAKIRFNNSPHNKDGADATWIKTMDMKENGEITADNIQTIAILDSRHQDQYQQGLDFFENSVKFEKEGVKFDSSIGIILKPGEVVTGVFTVPEVTHKQLNDIGIGYLNDRGYEVKVCVNYELFNGKAWTGNTWNKIYLTANVGGSFDNKKSYNLMADMALDKIGEELCSDPECPICNEVRAQLEKDKLNKDNQNIEEQTRPGNNQPIVEVPSVTPEVPISTPETPVPTPELPSVTPEVPIAIPEVPVPTPETLKQEENKETVEIVVPTVAKQGENKEVIEMPVPIGPKQEENEGMLEVTP
ncbi:MAG: hypothetical protein AB9856_00685 [Cellulosilyticaceae bacterium]